MQPARVGSLVGLGLRHAPSPDVPSLGRSPAPADRPSASAADGFGHGSSPVSADLEGPAASPSPSPSLAPEEPAGSGGPLPPPSHPAHPARPMFSTASWCFALCGSLRLATNCMIWCLAVRWGNHPFFKRHTAQCIRSAGRSAFVAVGFGRATHARMGAPGHASQGTGGGGMRSAYFPHIRMFSAYFPHNFRIFFSGQFCEIC